MTKGGDLHAFERMALVYLKGSIGFDGMYNIWCRREGILEHSSLHTLQCSRSSHLNPPLPLTLPPPHSQHPLRAPHLPLPPLHPPTRHPTRPRQRLKRALRPMMIILPPNHINMQRRPTRHRPATQPMVNHLAVQPPNHGTLEVEIADEEGARGDVEDGAGEGLVEGRVGVAEAGEAGAWA